MDDSGRVFLHKRMDMGNERSAFENHYFRNLFRKRPTVDGTGYRYAQLYRKAAAEVPNARGDFLASSGNPKLLCWLCIAVGAVSAAALGGALTDSFVLRILLTVLFAVLGAAASWTIHRGCKCFHLRNKQPLYVALGCVGGWLVMSLIAGQWQITLLGICVQILGGLANAYGGRRSELGRQTASEILGFRHYLKTVTREELQRILKVNPDYYYEMAPYALALGVLRPFAANFGSRKLDSCPYLVTKLSGKHTAEEWGAALADTADMIDERYRRMEIEKWMAIKLIFKK